jgi:DNA-binding MarR family transcriptional regulator
MADNANSPYRFGNLLALARRSWIEQVGERMQQAGFPGYRRTDAGVLARLLARPLAIGQLGEALGISRQAARQLADGLVERGYATFGTDDSDARRTLVVLTRRGKAYGQAIWMAQAALNERVRSRVSEADLAAADAVLRAVFPDDGARQRVDERMPPLSESPLSGRHGLRIVAARCTVPSDLLNPHARLSLTSSNESAIIVED